MTYSVDAGPMARLEAVKEDPITPGVVFERLAAGESLKTIARNIAKDCHLPVGPFTQWFTTTYPELFKQAQEALAHQDAHETVEIADSSTPETVGTDKLRIDSRKWRASKYDRDHYGDKTDVRHSGLVPTLVIEIGGAVEERVVGEAEEVTPLPEKLPATHEMI